MIIAALSYLHDRDTDTDFVGGMEPYITYLYMQCGSSTFKLAAE